MRNTRQKDLIFEIINNSYDHLNAYQVYEMAKNEIPNISLGTVYRNLSNLVRDNQIREIEVDGMHRFDRNDRHTHFLCNECEAIIDICDSVLGDCKYIDGNLVMDYEIKLKGICRKCMEGKDI